MEVHANGAHFRQVRFDYASVLGANQCVGTPAAFCHVSKVKSAVVALISVLEKPDLAGMHIENAAPKTHSVAKK